MIRPILFWLTITVLLGASLSHAQKTQKKLPLRIRISQEMAQKNIVKQSPPNYPDKARENGIEGTVFMQVVVGTDGKVVQVKVLSGQPILADAAVEAVKEWRYKPYLLNGQPVEVETQVKLDFRLDSSSRTE